MGMRYRNNKKIITVHSQDLSDATATADDILVGKTAYTGEGKVTGTYKDMLQEMVDQTNSCRYLFYGYSGTDLSFIKKLDISKVTNMDHMFNKCTVLTSLDVSWLNTSNITSMYNMFTECSSLTSLDLSNFNMSKVTTINGMFKDCYKLISLNLSNWDANKLTDAGNLFTDCRNITSVNFTNCNIPNLKWSNHMFSQCNKIETVNLSNINTSKVQSMTSMFNGCVELINILGIIDVYSCTSVGTMFTNCYKLTNLTLKNIKINLQIGSSTSWGTLLTNASLLNTAQELWDNSDQALGGARTLTMSTPSKTAIQSIYVKLITPTAEQEAADPYINNKKPCVECESTEEGAMTLEEYIISKNWSIA